MENGKKYQPLFQKYHNLMIQLDNYQPIEIKYDTKYIIVSYDCLAPADALYELFQTSVHRTCMLLWLLFFFFFLL